MNSESIYRAVYHAAKVLELPVIVLILAAVALTVAECGAFVAEVWSRRGRSLSRLAASSDEARTALDAGETVAATLHGIAHSGPMSRTLAAIAAAAGTVGGETRIAKELADFDFDRERRLARTRLLVRFGPALGLMGTLIPLAPALDGLARGKVDTLTDNLRVAFSVTVLGLLVGAVSYGLSLTRERFYGQDYSDLEYVAAVLTGPAAESTP